MTKKKQTTPVVKTWIWLKGAKSKALEDMRNEFGPDGVQRLCGKWLEVARTDSDGNWYLTKEHAQSDGETMVLPKEVAHVQESVECPKDPPVKIAKIDRTNTPKAPKKHIWPTRTLDIKDRVPKTTLRALILEDGLEHNYWFICTSEDKKIPAAIRRRAKCIEVKTLDNRTMTRLLARASKEEGITVPEAVRARIIEISNGSPGQALSHLETVAPLCVGDLDQDALREVLSILKESDEAAKNLGKALLDNAPLPEIREMLKGFQDSKEDPESLRRGVLGYATAALLNGWDRNARALSIIQVFASGTTYDSGFPCLVAMAMTAGGMQHGNEEEADTAITP